MTIDRPTAEAISTLFNEASALCDKSLHTVMSNENLGHVQIYGRLVGDFMGYSYTNILAPIWKKFPDLLPDEMKQPYVEEEPVLSPQSQEALRTFLVAARLAVSHAQDTDSHEQAESIFGFGGLKEVEASITAISSFLEKPRFHEEESDMK